jgi:hypothetical protein
MKEERRTVGLRKMEIVESAKSSAKSDGELWENVRTSVPGECFGGNVRGEVEITISRDIGRREAERIGFVTHENERSEHSQIVIVRGRPNRFGERPRPNFFHACLAK